MSSSYSQTCDTHMTLGSFANVPPVEFTEQVHDALERLYDFPFLQRHPLARKWQRSDDLIDELAGQRLRRELIAAIESLNPGRTVPFLSPQTRLYNLLHMRYVDGMTVQNAAHELGVSMRQAHRDLRHGEESVAIVLWAHRHTHSESADTHAASMHERGESFELHMIATDMCALTVNGCKVVGKLAEVSKTALKVSLPDQRVMVSTDTMAAQQVLTSLLSSVIRHARSGDIRVVLDVGSEKATLTLYYIPDPTSGEWLIDPMVRELARRLEWNVVEEDNGDSREQSLTIDMSMKTPTVLVIDDNKGLVELIERYLTGQPCRVVAALSGPDGLRTANDLLPNVVILDVMMPEMDGWEVLQLLRSNPRTAKLPVVICSVFNNPELASSLGATQYLCKPIRRDDILGALQRVGLI